MFLKLALLLFFASASGMATVEVLFTCWPQPILIGRWQIVISHEGENYSARTSYLADIHPGRQPVDLTFGVSYTEEESRIQTTAKGFDFEIYPKQIVTTYGGSRAVRAVAFDVRFAVAARLRDRPYACTRP